MSVKKDSRVAATDLCKAKKKESTNMVKDCAFVMWHHEMLVTNSHFFWDKHTGGESGVEGRKGTCRVKLQQQLVYPGMLARMLTLSFTSHLFSYHLQSLVYILACSFSSPSSPTLYIYFLTCHCLPQFWCIPPSFHNLSHHTLVTGCSSYWPVLNTGQCNQIVMNEEHKEIKVSDTLIQTIRVETL